MRYILRHNAPEIPNPFSVFFDVLEQHGFLCQARSAEATLLQAWQGETARVNSLRAQINAQTKAHRRVSQALLDQFDTAVKAQELLTRSIIWLRRKYVETYNELGPMEQAGYLTPQQMNFPPWAWVGG